MRIYGRRVRTSKFVFIYTYRGGLHVATLVPAIKAGRDRESFVVVIVEVEPRFISRVPPATSTGDDLSASLPNTNDI